MLGYRVHRALIYHRHRPPRNHTPRRLRATGQGHERVTAPPARPLPAELSPRSTPRRRTGRADCQAPTPRKRSRAHWPNATRVAPGSARSCQGHGQTVTMVARRQGGGPCSPEATRSPTRERRAVDARPWRERETSRGARGAGSGQPLCRHCARPGRPARGDCVRGRALVRRSPRWRPPRRHRDRRLGRHAIAEAIVTELHAFRARRQRADENTGCSRLSSRQPRRPGHPK
jgi:hypothetical protein